jgi:ribosomal protein S18 acetylase RimI-like enzyme
VNDLKFLELNHTDTHCSQGIRDLFRESYTVEAELIGVSDFPPLRRTAADIRSAPSTFVGCMIDDRLVAIAEIERSGDFAANIAGFAVFPPYFRRGIGSRLLRHILDCLGDVPVTVSTAWKNQPAIALYEAHGFCVARRWATDCGIDMATLLRNDEA